MSADPTGKPGAELRKDERQPIELKVEYDRLNTFFSDYTRNISKGGTFIKTKRLLPLGTKFLFKLFVPGRAEPLNIRGTVQHLARPDHVPEDKVGMGIRFVYDSDEERLRIEQAVESLMVDSLGQLLYAKLMDGGATSDVEKDGEDEP